MKSLLPASVLELRVLAGRQAGARARLDAQQDLLVCGVNASNQGDTQFADILLASDGDFQLRVVPTGIGRVGLQLIAGHAVLAERPLDPSDAIQAWAPGQPLRLGDTVVAYGPADQDEWPEPVMHDGPEAPEPRRALAPQPASRSMLEGVLTALGLVMVIGGASLAWRGGTLREAGQVVAKVVPPAQAATPATTPDLLASTVEVFRLHGIAAQASWSPEGELVLRTQERDAAKVQTAAAAARRDIARLPALRLDNQPPATAVAAAAPPAEDPAKRLVAVIDNADSPYFITADGSRYFSGALLPSGHRVVEIAGRAVVVERDGQRTRLTL
ncbi:SctD/MshK family protein [Roseateles sp. NT4]|uniref:SctD/MshK family protein n=1 Tax=Roseateles sp. NT4 TaxID=3453715 RepID=UPI003EEEE362